MADQYTTVSGGRKYFKYSECTKGDVLVDGGTFIGSEEGKYGIQHLFDVGGETVCLNSAAQLNQCIDTKVKAGDKVRIVYDGKITLAKGPMAGKDCNQFVVQVARDADTVEKRTIPAPTAETTVGAIQ